MAWFRRPGLGMLLLCIWLIASGVLALVPSLNFQAAPAVLAVLAIAAGVLLLLDR